MSKIMGKEGDSSLLQTNQEKEIIKDVTNKLAHYVARVKRIEDERNQMRGELESQSARLSSEIEGLEAALDKKEKELEAANDKISTLISQSKMQKAHLKTVEEEVTRYKRSAEDAALLRTQLDEEKQEHADTKRELYSVQKEISALRHKQSEARLAEKKIATQLVTKRSQLEALEKAYGHLEKSKGVEMDKLIKKKDEEVTAATEGWTAQHSKLYEALEIRLKKEHEDEMKKNDAVVAGLRRDLALKSAAMQEMAARHDLTVKVLEKKVKDLAERYRANTLLWQNKLQDAEEMKAEYQEATARYKGLVNPKLVFDAELLHIQEVLDAEESRQNKRKHETHPHDSFVRQVKRALLGRNSHPAKKSIVIKEINTKQDYVLLQNPADQDLPMHGWRLLNTNGAQEFEFPADYALKAHSTVTIWSTKIGSPKKKKGSAPSLVRGGSAPEHLVWEAQDVWEFDEHPQATLVDDKGVDVAKGSKNHAPAAPTGAGGSGGVGAVEETGKAGYTQLATNISNRAVALIDRAMSHPIVNNLWS